MFKNCSHLSPRASNRNYRKFCHTIVIQSFGGMFSFIERLPFYWCFMRTTTMISSWTSCTILPTHSHVLVTNSVSILDTFTQGGWICSPQITAIWNLVTQQQTRTHPRFPSVAQWVQSLVEVGGVYRWCMSSPGWGPIEQDIIDVGNYPALLM